MKKLSCMIVLCVALAFGCGKKDEGGDDKGGDKGKPAAAKVDVKPEMKTFMGKLDGKSDSVTAALKAHGVDGLDSKDMDMYNLEKATVTKSDGDCYTMDAKSGMTTRTYVLCWKDGKIASVEDKGMR